MFSVDLEKAHHHVDMHQSTWDYLGFSWLGETYIFTVMPFGLCPASWDQPSHDTEDRICPACKETDSIESIHHVLLHCPAYEHRRAALRTAIACLPAAQASPSVLLDDEGVVAIYEMTSWEEQRRQLLQ